MNPAAASIPAMIRAILCPKPLLIFAPSRPPMQKKLIARVKFSASAEALQPKAEAKGDFKMDQAYKTPAKSMEITPIAR